MIQRHKIKIPIFERDVWILLGDRDDVSDYLSDINMAPFEIKSKWDGVCFDYLGNGYIWFDIKYISVPIIVHELGHATFDLMLDFGLEITDQEAFCYIQQYLMKECCDIFAIQMDLTCLASTQEDEVQSS